MEKDLGTKLEWVAAEHYNTEHPHVHAVIRGVRDSGEVLRLSREYVQQGIRLLQQTCVRARLAIARNWTGSRPNAVKLVKSGSPQLTGGS